MTGRLTHLLRDVIRVAILLKTDIIGIETLIIMQLIIIVITVRGRMVAETGHLDVKVVTEIDSAIDRLTAIIGLTMILLTETGKM